MSGAATDLGLGGSSGPIKTITNYFSGGGKQSGTDIRASDMNNCQEVLSGALTANTLKRLVNKTGRGRANIVTAYALDTTSRTVRLQVIVDGQATPAFDATSSAITSVGRGIVAVGSLDSGNGAQSMQPIDYSTSFEVWVASSLSEADKVAVGLNLEEWQ